jgi:hypothetical protein
MLWNFFDTHIIDFRQYMKLNIQILYFSKFLFLLFLYSNLTLNNYNANFHSKLNNIVLINLVPLVYLINLLNGIITSYKFMVNYQL